MNRKEKKKAKKEVGSLKHSTIYAVRVFATLTGMPSTSYWYVFDPAVSQYASNRHIADVWRENDKFRVVFVEKGQNTMPMSTNWRDGFEVLELISSKFPSIAIQLANPDFAPTKFPGVIDE